MEHASLLGHSSSLLGTVGGVEGERVILQGNSSAIEIHIDSECAVKACDAGYKQLITKQNSFTHTYFKYRVGIKIKLEIDTMT